MCKGLITMGSSLTVDIHDIASFFKGGTRLCKGLFCSGYALAGFTGVQIVVFSLNGYLGMGGGRNELVALVLGTH